VIFSRRCSLHRGLDQQFAEANAQTKSSKSKQARGVGEWHAPLPRTAHQQLRF
jgi:hypothetical protein